MSYLIWAGFRHNCCSVAKCYPISSIGYTTLEMCSNFMSYILYTDACIYTKNMWSFVFATHKRCLLSNADMSIWWWQTRWLTLVPSFTHLQGSQKSVIAFSLQKRRYSLGKWWRHLTLLWYQHKITGSKQTHSSMNRIIVPGMRIFRKFHAWFHEICWKIPCTKV